MTFLLFGSCLLLSADSCLLCLQAETQAGGREALRRGTADSAHFWFRFLTIRTSSSDSRRPSQANVTFMPASFRSRLRRPEDEKMGVALKRWRP